VSETPWRRSRKTRHQLQEERIGDSPEGQKGVNSGRFWRWKRDGRIGEFLIEARTTKDGSYRIERKEFLSITREAMQTPPGLLPMMQLEIQELRLTVLMTNDFDEIKARMLSMEAALDSQEK
jgi:hypothetical protein